jgi:hypothetical protein
MIDDSIHSPGRIDIMFNLTPPFHNSNPLFRIEIRQVRWGQSPAHLWRFGAVVLVTVIPLVVVFSWLYMRQAYPAFGNTPYPGELDFFYLLLMLGILANVFTDFACLLFTITGMTPGQNVMWDMLRLTPSGMRLIVQARYAIAQIRGWRVAIFVVAFRAAIIMVIVLYLLNGAPFPNVVIEGISLLPALGVLALVYVVEPLWRIQALIGIGLRESARRPGMNIVMGILAVLRFWVIQCGLVMLLGIGGMLNTALFFFQSPTWGTLIWSCGIAVFVYGLYDRENTRNLERWLVVGAATLYN